MCRLPQPDDHRHCRNQHCGVCVGRSGQQGQSHSHETQTGQFVGTCVCIRDLTATARMYLHPQKHWPSFPSQPLYGHTDSVTCLAVSEVYSVIVSGSRDLTCILWDMEELSYITQLAGHTTSISALAINELTVSLLDLRLWNSLLTVLSDSHSVLFFSCSLPFLAHCCHVVPLQSAHTMRKKGFSLLTMCISSLHVFFFFFLCFVSLHTWASIPYHSVQGRDCIMCGTCALPVDHEGSAAGLHWHFLRASARRPVCQLHTETRVGRQERRRHWLCRWHHTSEFVVVYV